MNNSIRSLDNNGLGMLGRVLMVALGGIFVVAGVIKGSDPNSFEASLLHFALFPDWMVPSLVTIIPFIEITAGLMCLTARFGGYAAQFLLFLTAAYTLFLFVSWLRGVEPDCACFGSQSSHWPYWALFARNLGLLLIEAFLIYVSLPGLAIPSGRSSHLRSKTQ